MIDTREHEGKFSHITDNFDKRGITWKRYKLNYGDYSFMLPANDEYGISRDLYFNREIVIERKANLDEFCGNITGKDRDRIQKEFALAPPRKVLVIENASYEDVINGNYRSDLSARSLYATLHTFWHRYDIPPVFIKDPKYTPIFILGYFQYYLREIIR